MVRFGDREITKERFYAAKRPIKICNVNVDIIVISNLVIARTSSKYLIGYVKTFKVKEGNNKLMSFHIDDEKLLEKYKAIWTKIEDLKNIKLNALPVYYDRYIKTKIRKFVEKVYANFCGLDVAEDDIECQSFTVISIDCLLVYGKKYYLQVYLDNCAKL